MSFEKENFLRTRLVRHLQQLDSSTPPRWGKMNVLQMIEHYTNEAVRIASGQAHVEKIVTAPERLPAFRDFMMSDRPFKENTANPILPEEPRTPRHHTVQAAIGVLHEELIYFFAVFASDPRLITRHPIFGDLNFEENVQLLYKHALHHLKQFGVEPMNT